MVVVAGAPNRDGAPVTELLLKFAHTDWLEATRWNAILWSIADVAICAIFIDIIDRCRRAEGLSRRRELWTLLALSIVFTPLLYFAPSHRTIMRIEIGVCGAQFLILVWGIASEWRRLVRIYETRFR